MAYPRARFWADVDRGESWADVEDDMPVHGLASWNMLLRKQGKSWRPTSLARRA